MYNDNENTNISNEVGKSHYVCERRSLVCYDQYNAAVEKYMMDLNEYNRKKWYIRLFTSKPVKPKMVWYM